MRFKAEARLRLDPVSEHRFRRRWWGWAGGWVFSVKKKKQNPRIYFFLYIERKENHTLFKLPLAWF